MMNSYFEENDFLACCGSSKFAREMTVAQPFATCEQAVQVAKDLWFNKVDVNAWLEAFAGHPQIGEKTYANQKNETSAQWSNGEQSAALATATDSSLQELLEWNARYRRKFGFVFLICASGKSTPEILTELKNRYLNRPIVEFDIAAKEQMKITELRLSKLFAANVKATSLSSCTNPASLGTKAGEDRLGLIGAHLTSASEILSGKASHTSGRTRPPITTHVLDIARGSPGNGVEVLLEMWKGTPARPLFGKLYSEGWVYMGSSITDSDGRSGHLMNIVDSVDPGIYRISFNTGKYNSLGFFPSVSIVFEIKESQRREHFHVPLLLSPFGFSTYRGS